VDAAAADRLAVLAGSAAGVAALAAGCTVDGAEAGGGQGGEEAGSVAYCVGDVLAAGQSGADQVVGVAGVEPGAGFADGRSTVAAADGQALEGFGGGVVVVEDFPGGRIPGGGGAGQVDRVGAAARGGDLLEPAGVLGVVGESDDVLVGVAEPAQARRAVEDGAPALRGGGGGDGGGALSGWAAEAAGVNGGWGTVMGDRSLSCWCACGSADGAGAAADAAAAAVSGPGVACSLALAGRAADALHGHTGAVLPGVGQVWRKPPSVQPTVAEMLSLTGEAAR
jgi:hypothetical protein